VNTPILFIIFNRPETTRLVFERIRQAKPTRLFVSADGPRSSVPGEAERCREARAIVKRQLAQKQSGSFKLKGHALL